LNNNKSDTTYVPRTLKPIIKNRLISDTEKLFPNKYSKKTIDHDEFSKIYLNTRKGAHTNTVYTQPINNSFYYQLKDNIKSKRLFLTPTRVTGNSLKKINQNEVVEFDLDNHLLIENKNKIELNRMHNQQFSTYDSDDKSHDLTEKILRVNSQIKSYTNINSKRKETNDMKQILKSTKSANKELIIQQKVIEIV
jgi:hypothetical protein